MSFDIIEDLKWRYACKKFDPEKKLSEEQVDALLESLRLTASSYGLQPWKFILVKNEKLREELVAASYGQQQVKDASHLIVMCEKEEIDEAHVDAYMKDICETRGVEADSLAGFKKMLIKMIVQQPAEKRLVWAKNQIYIALGTLLTVCANLKIDSCPMEGFKPNEVDKILGLHEKDLRSVLLCPVGFRADDDVYTEKLKVRFKKDEVVEIL
ncbi:MAG: NAD(P)H-dependent oxidoreductase [Halobacteriovoraceae bacterium]|nr:NAD(P)H-dependent oxidoreductase [Halobacteriovoraceae bacterium]|tara:strand:+ start:215751 stop:216386 length:636 start_codon:yes stop_codon:yes gene_type:complete